ncbi:uncharacterized protein BDR25DRAFT_116598 [Lindgomyces ingoldianus]|uniref:Uncharacterized protein n=1 Tax=Lindgomyces ingoldianus TaxID=673940 RepID=A0ACB6Q875_9PLEO|nr:uncharacterized protein BDR25DRAFT_116598 [Lindgomyces ingoldianus]KAF2463081.1 hypothetical protein BDR25DRAFT_116598 [Lindgomyces ingoldianus]
MSLLLKPHYRPTDINQPFSGSRQLRSYQPRCEMQLQKIALFGLISFSTKACGSQVAIKDNANQCDTAESDRSACQSTLHPNLNFRPHSRDERQPWILGNVGCTKNLSTEFCVQNCKCKCNGLNLSCPSAPTCTPEESSLCEKYCICWTP